MFQHTKNERGFGDIVREDGEENWAEVTWSVAAAAAKKEGEEEPTERERQKPSPKNIYAISSKEFHFIAGGKALEEDEIKERKKRLEKEKLVRVV